MSEITEYHKGDKYGCVDSVVVERLPGDKTAKITLWTRSGHKCEFVVALMEAPVIARRLAGLERGT